VLHFSERPPADSARGLLILHHGRGTDDQDLLPLADVLDPGRELHVVSARAPLQLPGAPGFHWYQVQRVGYPDRCTFHSSRQQLADFHDAIWERLAVEPERTILGGFSMGAVMSYALGLSGDRPAPAGILAFSGFIPAVEGWEPETGSRQHLPVLIAHGRRDPVIGVEFARRARELLEGAGLAVDYRESEAAHSIDPADIARAVEWVRSALTSS
jgi:phospholipase/carboxylesterase